MHFQLQRNDLMDIIATASRAIATKSTMPILEGILVEAAGGKLTLMCTDMMLGISCSVPADIIEEGRVVMPGRMFAEIVRKIPDGTVDVSINEQLSATIRCMGSRTTLAALDAEEFPELPAVSGSSPITLQKNVLRDMIRHTLFATATEETRPILTGALLEREGEETLMVALDGYRLALWRCADGQGGDPVHAVIPGKSLGEIAKILDDGEEEMDLSIDGSHLMVCLENTTIVTRLLEGEFIKYRQIIPGDFSTRVKINTRALSDSIDRASLMVREGKSNLIRLAVEEDKLIITANSDIGNVYEEIPITLDGKTLEIAFNARYFSDMLKVLEDEEIELNFSSNVSPCVVKPVEGDSYIYLILPVRIYGA